MAALNEVPGNESRQIRRGRLIDALHAPSMKCREMNPGKAANGTCLNPIPDTLNEVPGNESRQIRGWRAWHPFGLAPQ